MSDPANPAGAPAATPTPAPAAPATTPAAPSPSPAPSPAPAPAGPTPIVFEPTGNAGLDLALEFIGSVGIDPNDPAMKAAEQGNFDQLEALLRGKGDSAKGFERYLALGKEAWKSFDAEQKAKVELQKKAVHDGAGGEQRWAEVEAWAKQNAEPAEREAINQAIAIGGIAAKAMSFYMTHLFGKANGTSYDPAERVSDPNAGNGRGNQGDGPLSPADYTAAVGKLRQQLGSRFEGSREYAHLQARRRAYRG